MADKNYQLEFTMSDGSKKTLSFTAPQGPTGATGAAGKNGSDGVGIASIKQTTTSTADDGNNIFTVTLTNGKTSTFTVQNGSKGSKGDAGATGAQGVGITSIDIAEL